jgi:hypothetical protein
MTTKNKTDDEKTLIAQTLRPPRKRIATARQRQRNRPPTESATQRTGYTIGQTKN